MKLPIVVAIALPLVTLPAFARIGETPKQLDARYGAPIKRAFDDAGNGMCIYHREGFKEIRVRFSKNASDQEEYVVGYSSPPSLDTHPNTELVKRIQSENPKQEVEDHYDRVRVSSVNQPPKTVNDDKVNSSAQEHTYSGVAKIRTDEQGEMAIFNEHATVIEAPMHIPGSPSLFRIETGHTYSITTISDLDLNALSVVVGKREHVDWADSTEDVGLAGIQHLVRIAEGDKVIFDESICSLHSIKMEKRNVEIAYGMLAYSNAESYCMAHFPYSRAYAVGGCVVTPDSPKFAPIYICPKCVAECNEYKRQHPEKHE